MSSRNFLCIVALREEMKYINDFLSNRSRPGSGIEVVRNSPTGFDIREKEHHYSVSSRQPPSEFNITFVVADGMGQLTSALITTKYLNEDTYDAVFIIGIAGTLDEERFRLGDVVVAAGCKYLSFDRIGTIAEDTSAKHGKYDLKNSPLPGNGLRIRRAKVTSQKTDSRLTSYFRAIANRRPPGMKDLMSGQGTSNDGANVHHGIILGSDWVVDSSDWVSFLGDRNTKFDEDWYRTHGDEDERRRTDWMDSDIACLDMESYGFFEAALKHSDILHAISVRGISDACKNKSKIEKERGNTVRDTACTNAAAVLIDLMFVFGSLGRK
jgi:nucleoside phosphorylase